MRCSAVLLFLMFIICSGFSQTADLKLSPYLIQLQERDTICKVWVYFSDKSSIPAQSMISPRGLARRATSGIQTDLLDCPVNNEYIAAVTKIGGILQNVYKWGNAASFRVHTSKLTTISMLSFVLRVSPVVTFKKRDSVKYALKKSTQDNISYIKMHQQSLDMLFISQAHHYLYKNKNAAKPGNGVFVGFFDSGFRLDHECFSFLKDNNKIKASRDFVDADNDPQDSDSLLNHGSLVLSQTIGYDPGTFMGTAWGVDVALARTEISEQEVHAEEDNWAAALVWAESLGVDIVSSSLGYSDTFIDSVLVNGQYVTDYPYSFFDGNSTIVSRAAKLAVQRGLLIVNAIGNEGSDILGTLTAPSDVDGVIAVGSVNLDTTISEFSSTGPTADERIKPDCVAPGHMVITPKFSSEQNLYALRNGGTSFSTPRVTGIVAMIVQVMGKPYSADAIRNRLFKYCTFIPNQSSVNNMAGYGIPNALLSIMSDNEIFIESTDSSNIPLINAIVHSNTGEILGYTDDSGVIILKNITAPTKLSVTVPGDTTQLSFQTTPAYRHVVLNSTIRLDILVRDIDEKPISSCNVSFKIEKSGSFVLKRTDESGSTSLICGAESPVKIFISSPGYYSPDSIATNLTDNTQPLIITLIKVPSNVFVVYPNVIKSNKQTIRALFSHATEGFKPAKIQAAVYSVDGTLIWNTTQMSQPGIPAFFEWNGSSSRAVVAPGIYYFVVQFNKETFRKKFLIVG